jgi:mannose-6-phosphate isomerase-like protein (cupin superfamily)
MTIRKVDLADAFSRVPSTWCPYVVAEVNGTQVRVARLDGAFVWHRHEAEDELFLVVSGRLRIRLRDGEVELGPGQMAVVPRGVEHLPVAEGECHVLLLEPGSTRNTGDVSEARTVEAPAWLPGLDQPEARSTR